MKIALTGATGFVGQALLKLLNAEQITVKAWHRSDVPKELSSLYPGVEWSRGELGDHQSVIKLLKDCDTVVHTALFRPGDSWSVDGENIREYLEKNFMGTIDLIDQACKLGVKRFVLFSTCAVHDKILIDRKLDEAHPLWPKSHYGAHKAALEKFVSSYGQSKDLEICALRPTGIYGLKQPIEKTKWYSLVSDIAKEKEVTCSRGGKEVHVADVAKATMTLLRTKENISGESYNCYDRYISEWDVAQIAKELLGSSSKILGEQTTPKHQIETSKIKNLGMEFGGEPLLRETIEQMIQNYSLF